MKKSEINANVAEDIIPEMNWGKPGEYDWRWNERNADIYRYLLANSIETAPELVWFITITPKCEWSASGDWTEIPDADMDLLPAASHFRSPRNAYLKDDHILEKDTNAKAVMRWISVKRWYSDTVVEVEDGAWLGPGATTGSTTVYEKVNGNWEVKWIGLGWTNPP
jgi:hypothetical protein